MGDNNLDILSLILVNEIGRGEYYVLSRFMNDYTQPP